MDVTLNRSHIQEAYEVFKHLQDRRSAPLPTEKVLVRSEPGKVVLVGSNEDVDALFLVPVPDNQSTIGPFLVPFAALAELSKGADGPVTLSGEPEAPVVMERYPLLNTEPLKRNHFVDWTTLRQHLRNAGNVAAAAQDRYSINRICLTQSSVVSTDGRHLYAGNSLSLPLRKGQQWLVSPPKLFASKTLGNFGKVSLVRDEKGLILRFGENWIVRLNRHGGHFPRWQEIVPKLDQAKAKLTIPEAVAVDLPERLRQLFDGANAEARLCLKLGAKNILTAMSEDGKEVRSMELLDVTRSGEQMTLLFDPKYFIHALKMGFLTLHFFSPSQPVIGTRGSDIYLWMPCVNEGMAANPSPESKVSSPVIESTTGKETVTPQNKAEPQKAQAPMDINAVLSELDAIKDVFRDLTKRIGVVQVSIRTRTADLQKREKAVQQALASLKELAA